MLINGSEKCSEPVDSVRVNVRSIIDIKHVAYKFLCLAKSCVVTLQRVHDMINAFSSLQQILISDVIEDIQILRTSFSTLGFDQSLLLDKLDKKLKNLFKPI